MHLSHLRYRRDGRYGIRVGAATLALAIATSLLVVPSAAQAAKPPPNPSDSQLSGAAREKADLAEQVGQLGAQVAATQTQLQQLQASQELAEQKLAFALQKLEQAKQAAAAARAQVSQAQALVDDAQYQFRSYARPAIWTVRSAARPAHCSPPAIRMRCCRSRPS